MDKEYSERLDRIEHHLRLLKDSDVDKTTLLLNIQNALIGSALNGNKGMVKQINDIDDRVEDLEIFKGEISVYVNQFKVAFVIIFGALVTLIFKLFSLK
jgi:aspartate ammonia-lyase